MSSINSSKNALTGPSAGNHFVQVYQDVDTLAGSVCHFISDQLKPSEAAIIVATSANEKAIKRELIARGVDLQGAIDRGQYRFFDAEALLSSVLVDGMPDIDKCDTSMKQILAEVCQEYESVRVYGEAVNILWQRNKKEAAKILENYWNGLFKEYAFSMMCAYYMDNLDPAAYHGDIECLCSSHTHFLPSQDFQLLDEALQDASEDVMGVSLKGMMNSIAKFSHPTTIMPASQASLLYISKTMPMTTEFILNRIRQKLVKPETAA